MEEGNYSQQQLAVGGGLVLLALSLVLLTIISWALMKRKSTEGRRFPRGPPAWPIIGHLPLLRARPHKVLTDLAMNKGYGPIMGLRLGSHPAVVVSSTALAKELLLTHDKIFANRVPYLFTDTVFYGYNQSVIFSSYNPRWAWFRKIYTLELLTAKRMQELRHIRHEEVRNLLHRLSEASRGGSHAVDVAKFLADMSANSVARIVQSKTLAETSPELPELMRALEDENFPTLGDFIPCLKFMDAFPKRKMKHLHDRIDKVLNFVVSQRRQLMTTCPLHELPNDFLQVFLSKEAGKDEQPITANELKGSMLDMFGAGIHTTTSTLEWSIAELLRNPVCLNKLQAEVNLLNKETREIISDEDVQNMPYLENVVKEVLRLHPVVPLLIPRISSAECEVGGYTLPKGTHTFVNVWAISRDPLIWDKPEDFYPERFEEKDLDMRGQHYELLPFGSGRRMCPGMRMGISVVKVTLANLVKFFDWELPHGQSPSSIDMSERPGLASSKATPLLAIPKAKYASL